MTKPTKLLSNEKKNFRLLIGIFVLLIAISGCNGCKPTTVGNKESNPTENNTPTSVKRTPPPQEYQALYIQASKVLQSYPSEASINASKNMTDGAKKFLVRVREVLVSLNDSANMTSHKYDSLMNEMGWIQMVLNTIIPNEKFPKSTSSTGTTSGTTTYIYTLPATFNAGIHFNSAMTGGDCVAACHTQYDECMKSNDCSYHWLCICCIPCSLQYAGCITGCTVGTIAQ